MESEATWVDFITVQSSLSNLTFRCIGHTSKNVRCRRPIGLQARNDVRTTLEPWDNSTPPAKELKDVLSKLLCPSHQSKKFQDEYLRRWTDESAVHGRRLTSTPPARSHLAIPQIDRSRAGSAPPDLDPGFIDGFKCGISSCKSAITSLEDSFGRLAITRTPQQNEESTILEVPSGPPEGENIPGQSLSDEDSSDSSDAEFMSAISSPSRPPPHWRAQMHAPPYTALATASRSGDRTPAAARSSPARPATLPEPPEPLQPAFRVQPVMLSPPHLLSESNVRCLERQLVDHLKKEQSEKQIKYVYVFTAAELPGLVKVGMTEKVRVRQSQVGKCGFKHVQMEYMSKLLDRAKMVEGLTHKVLDAWGFNVKIDCPVESHKTHEEWYSCDKEVAIRIIKIWAEVQKHYQGAYPTTLLQERLDDFSRNGGPVEDFETLNEMIERHRRYWISDWCI